MNGIAATPDGRYLVLAKSNTGELTGSTCATGRSARSTWAAPRSRRRPGPARLARSTPSSGRVEPCGFVVEIRLSGDLGSGTVVGRTTDPTFDDPTTAALAGGRLLVVNSQFGERGGVASSSDPFTVSSIPLP